MAIYVGGIKRKVILNGNVYDVNICSSTPITNDIRLLSSDGFTLRDLNGLYLTVEYVEQPHFQLATLNNEILLDLNQMYLMVKEEDE